jgi:hypothetical protein
LRSSSAAPLAFFLSRVPNENSDPFLAELTYGFQPDAFVGTGDEGDSFVVHIFHIYWLEANSLDNRLAFKNGHLPEL